MKAIEFNGLSLCMKQTSRTKLPARLTAFETDLLGREDGKLAMEKAEREIQGGAEAHSFLCDSALRFCGQSCVQAELATLKSKNCLSSIELDKACVGTLAVRKQGNSLHQIDGGKRDQIWLRLHIKPLPCFGD